MFKPYAIVRGKTKGCWSVCLLHVETGKRYWLDVCLKEEYHDFEIDWNQYIFYMTDHDDVERKAFQEDCDNADEAFSEAVNILQAEGEVFQDAEGDWYTNDEWKAEGVKLIEQSNK